METPAFVKQELETQYTDFKKLGRKLKELFPSVKCKVVPKEDDVTIIYVPRVLEEDEKRSFMTLTS